MLTIPKILDTPEFYDVPLDYKWDEDASGYLSVDAQNPKLEKELNKLTSKAVFGIATALCEWIYWRMHKHINKPGIPLALEAQWAGIIDKDYFYSWSYEADYISDAISGPTYAMWGCVQYISYNYEQGIQGGMTEDTARLAIIARLICPIPKIFDQWLTDVIKKSLELFPYQESSNESPIPRQFYFDSDYDYKTADNVKIINDFLSLLDYKSNEFINSPKDMIKAGFQGIPYKYKPE